MWVPHNKVSDAGVHYLHMVLFFQHTGYGIYSVQREREMETLGMVYLLRVGHDPYTR